MKIIFNYVFLNKYDLYWQIYDELVRNHEIILIKDYLYKSKNNKIPTINVLEKCVRDNQDADFIFHFYGEIPDIIKWSERNIKMPIVILEWNPENRPYKAKSSIFIKVWYCGRNARSLMEKYNKDNLIYQGMAANPHIFHPIEIKKEYDVSFFGQHYGERKYWLKEIKRFCSENKIKYYLPLGLADGLPLTFEDINRIYNQSKINLSFAPLEPCGRIINLRTFEMCMSGNFQLMQYTPNIKEYFEIDKEIVCWRNKKELFEKILYYLENKDEREKIAKSGYKKAKKNHTWSKRFDNVYKVLKEKKIEFELKESVQDLTQIQCNIRSNRVQLSELPTIIEIRTKVLVPILKSLGYNVKRELKYKDRIIVDYYKDFSPILNPKFYYKPDLKNYYFIELLGKVMIVIKIISGKAEIKLKDWEELKKILLLIENFDSTIPSIGVITNGIQWIIKDFENETWLKRIPTRKELRAQLELLNPYFFKLRYYIYNNCHRTVYRFYLNFFSTPRINLLLKLYYKLPNVNDILIRSKIYINIRNLIRKSIISRYIYFAEIVFLDLLEKKNTILDPLSGRILFIND